MFFFKGSLKGLLRLVDLSSLCPPSTQSSRKAYGLKVKGTLKKKVQFSEKNGLEGYVYIMVSFSLSFFRLLFVYFVLKGRCFLLPLDRAVSLWCFFGASKQ